MRWKVGDGLEGLAGLERPLNVPRIGVTGFGDWAEPVGDVVFFDLPVSRSMYCLTASARPFLPFRSLGSISTPVLHFVSERMGPM